MQVHMLYRHCVQWIGVVFEKKHKRFLTLDVKNSNKKPDNILY